MTGLITNRETGTTHIVANEDEADWKQDRGHCGHIGVGRELSENNAVDASEGLCQTCRDRAEDSVVMEIYEIADEQL